MAGRTSTLRLERGAPDVHAPTWRTIASIHEDTPRPVTLRVDARVLAPLSDEEQGALVSLAGGAGVWWAGWDGGAAMRLTYGSIPGIRRTLYADLRAGDYVLPACNAVDVAVAYWNPNPDASDDLGTYAMEVAAELVDGDCGDSSPLRVSAVRALGASGSCPVPPGTYAWDAYAPGQASFVAQCGTIRAERGPGVWTPPTHPYVLTGPDAHRVYLTADVTDGSWLAGLVFYVR